MKSISGKTLACFIACAVFSVLSMVSFVLIQFGLHGRFTYYTVVSGGRMFFYSVMVLLPLIVGAATVLLYRKIGRRTKVTLCCLLAASVVISFVFVIAFSILPPCASVTDKADNYLVFDESCPASLISYNGMFPEIIPSEAENVRYYYRYSQYPDLCYDVFAQWTLPRSEYEAERQRLAKLFPNAEVETAGDYNVVFLSDEKKSTLDHIAFAFNDKTFTFRYMVSYIENVDINDLAPYYENLNW